MQTDNNSLFIPFAKFSEADTKPKTNYALIYTRVSTKEQTENLSLPVQLKGCQHVMESMKLEVVGYFGGTYESAQSDDERREFNKMLSFAKKSPQKVSYIIVYSMDRFSRTGGNAIYIRDKLKKQGIVIISATQPMDATTPGGEFQQDLYLVFSKYDNNLRREKCVAGIKEKLQRGLWVTKAPFGYDHIKSNGETMIVVNERGRLLRKAFLWKANEQVSSAEILKRLAALGLKLNSKRLSRLFRNPFYCGMLSHQALNGTVVEGKHEKLVSKEIFLEANNVLQSKRSCHKQNPINDNLPLKRFMKCETCGQYLRGYIKKGIHYYKCNTIGCGSNKSAKRLHEMFEEIVQHFTLDKSYVPAFRDSGRLSVPIASISRK